MLAQKTPAIASSNLLLRENNVAKSYQSVLLTLESQPKCILIDKARVSFLNYYVLSF